ncbi:MAG TPA: ComEC/Rec2 family competence protein, partial [Chlamydiales bacterium]|nr:ComEC/Rec2 family competence protein [Chlamydiales bacterium]
MSEFYGAMFYIGRMFWKKHPALALGIATLLGCFVALQPSWCLFIPAVFVVFLPRVLTLQSLLMGLLTYFFASYSVVMPQGQAERSWRGSALCEVIDLKQEIKYGEPLWKMKLHIHSFHGDCDAKNFPATTICKTIAKRPQGGCTYKVQGTLKKVSDSGVSFSFREQSKEGWRKKEEKFSLVEWRNLAKMRLKCFFRGHLPPGEARIFLEGLAFGEFHDPVLQENIRRLGLSHIMVVSGFHFSLIALFMAFVFSFFFSWKRSILALLIGATLYLLL